MKTMDHIIGMAALALTAATLLACSDKDALTSAQQPRTYTLTTTLSPKGGVETRSQQDNRQRALLILKSRLYDIELKKRQEKQAELEGQKKKIEWGSQIRSYVLHPYKMVKDLRTGWETADTQGVLDGDLNDFMKEYLMHN